ncbi:CD1375 family protein [Gottschalkia purinilytica]|nr:CD1375 family protein [Gottschalkia purinilytica]
MQGMKSEIKQVKDIFVIYIECDDGFKMQQDIDYEQGGSIYTRERAEELLNKIIQEIIIPRYKKVPIINSVDITSADIRKEDLHLSYAIAKTYEGGNDMNTIYDYMIPVYGILVKGNLYNLEEVQGSEKDVVPEAYRVEVAKYLAQQVN